MTQLIVYHGSNKRFDKFSPKAKRVSNDFFGGGVAYTTDDKNIALTYSRAMTYRYGGEEYLYQIKLDLKNIFDVDYVFTGKELTVFLKYIKPEEFLRGAGLLTPGEDKYAMISKLELGNLILNGKDVFRGISKGFVNSSGAETILKKMGYDGLRYNGGENMHGGHHNVYIPYYEKSIKIEKTFKVQRKRPINEDTGIGHMIFARATLPQVRDYNEFLSHMNLIGVDYNVGRMNADKLKATQLDGFDAEKVEALKKEKDVDPIIVSSDDFILDGHHRWLARKELGKSVPVYKIALPILELIRVAQDLYKIDYSEDITELFAGLKPTLYNHLDFVKLKYSLDNNILEGRWHHSIPLVHIKDGFTGQRTREVTGTSLTRNPNLDFDRSYHYMFELDRNKISQSNKIHVIDADNVAYGNNPHSSEASRNRTRNNVRDSWKQSMNNSLTKGAPMVMNDFAEEFVEGNLTPLNKYLRSIWVKPSIMDSIHKDSYNEVVEILGHYALDKNVSIKEFPSGKDLTAEWIDAAANMEPIVKFVPGYHKKKSFATNSLSMTLAKIRKSINTQ